ncbi:sulfurtransferase TusA family protein [Snodgrassella sp. B3882]|uniref:sulfurtransferase TusA family protein n=1 Tax=Snodgrassella sp. B3882 TaxID=2818037 RepID=UPI00226AB30F|nr:sulfurtransferase TusA family protein [Snodgrassella sp. B3882]MCX8745297.1 sulfurtransferase TusA family protein [Snodgrassella sp. B3882]
MNIPQFDETLDVTGMNCPLPILRAKKALARMNSEQTLRLFATDKSAPEDFAAFCRQTGHILLVSEQGEDGVFEIVIKHR